LRLPDLLWEPTTAALGVIPLALAGKIVGGGGLFALLAQAQVRSDL
jgi:hypothetical protein